jgi:probable H4MPT-linked C1 transfer pathway protein
LHFEISNNAIIGWDIGGAHLKAVALVDGQVAAVEQTACPLWQGLLELDLALDRILDRLPSFSKPRHVITMTGELTDAFASRSEGVLAITEVATRRFGRESVHLFSGDKRPVPAADVSPDMTGRMASANWLASGFSLAGRIAHGLFMDVGSTTTDLLLIENHQPRYRGYADNERLFYQELMYTGIVRTPVMMMAKAAPLRGQWAHVMAEVFATSADVYRLTGELQEAADQYPAADHGAKSPAGSQLRLARQFGYDAMDLSPKALLQLSAFIREQQIQQLRSGVDIQLSLGSLDDSAPLIGAGIGRFLVKDLAMRLRRPYKDFGDLFKGNRPSLGFDISDMAPAAAVAFLAFDAAIDP